MPKKLNDEFKYEENVEEVVEEPKYKKEPKKKAYTAILITDKEVLYEHTPGQCTSTPNIWEGKLKIGDTIYLDEG